MERNEVQTLRKLELVVNGLLIAVALLTIVGVAWGLDTQDIIVEWTPEGKKLEMQRVAGSTAAPSQGSPDGISWSIGTSATLMRCRR